MGTIFEGVMKSNLERKTLAVLVGVVAVFLALTVAFLTNLWGRSAPLLAIPVPLSLLLTEPQAAAEGMMRNRWIKRQVFAAISIVNSRPLY